MPEMSDATSFLPPGDLPPDSYEAGVLRWVQDRMNEGEGILKSEPAYDDMDKMIANIMGDQLDPNRPADLAGIVDNRLKNIVNQTVAALTDIHPLFGFKTYNPAFQPQEDVLIKLSQSWWVNTFADLKLADVIKFAAGAGTGYCEVAWDASMYGGTGDIVLRALDPRDIIPIKPTISGSVQDWEGVIIRTSKTPGELRVRYPDRAHRIVPDNQPSLLGRSWTRAKRLMSKVISPAPVDVLMASSPKNMPRMVQTTEVYSVYIKDRRLCVDAEPRIMGDPNTTWSYTVYPVGWEHVPNGIDEMGQPKYRKADLQDSKLYPRGRLIICTKKCVLYDGPNPYWHGMHPVAKLQLDPWPWAMLGTGLAHDLLPLQNALNEILNGLLDHIRKLLRPAVVADKKAVAQSLWERIDTRVAGLKIKKNAATGQNVEFVSPEPLPSYTFDAVKFLVQEMDNLAGTANLTALTQLQQVPGDDTIERMVEALTPTLRLKGRLLEYFLREVGEMVKACLFQFYNMPRRVAMLGEAGIVMDDFDFDPGTLVPAMSQQDANYIPELDKSRSRADRAQWFHKNFTFTITPNSLLAISQMSRKMMYLQLWRGGLMDPWSLFEVLEIPNGGAPPGDATTIIDRLIAAQMMGIGMATPNAAGRPPSGQKPPSLQSKDGGARQTVSESGGGGRGGGGR